MARALATGGHDPTILVPVPLHSVRRRERGFDQARLLADALGRRTGRPVVDALRRRRPTPSQVGLGRAARAANVRDAFGSTLRLGGERVGLVDDVATSGATLVASATSLLEAGAGRVTGVTWTLALAPADR